MPIKAVILDDHKRLVGRFVVESVGYFQGRIREALTGALDEASCLESDLRATCVTGFGARCADDITPTLFASDSNCHARGATHFFDPPLTLLDLGAREPTLIQVDENGARVVSKSLRKCAVGIGSFMTFAARHLGVPPARLMELASAAEQPTPINSYCTVFAETALLEQLRGGASREQVALGCMHSVAQRVMEIGHFTDPLVVTGGLPVYYPGVVAAIEEKAGIVVKVAPQSIMCGALGAALMAFDTV